MKVKKDISFALVFTGLALAFICVLIGDFIAVGIMPESTNPIRDMIFFDIVGIFLAYLSIAMVFEIKIRRKHEK
jgi:hypothetical protein